MNRDTIDLSLFNLDKRAAAFVGLVMFVGMLSLIKYDRAAVTNIVFSLTTITDMLMLFVCSSLLLFCIFIKQTQLINIVQKRVFTWHWPAFLLIWALDSILPYVQSSVSKADVLALSVLLSLGITLHYIVQNLAIKRMEIAIIAALVFVVSLLLLYLLVGPYNSIDSSRLFQPLSLITVAASSGLIAASWRLLAQDYLADFKLYLLPLVIGLMGLSHTVNYQFESDVSHIVLALILLVILIHTGYAMLRMLSRYVSILQKTLEHSPSVLFCGDLKGRLLFANDACKQLFSTDKGTGLKSIRHPFVGHPLWPKIQASLNKGETWTSQMSIKDGNGRLLSVRAELAPLLDANGAWYRATIVDLQERVDLLEQRATAEEKLERLSFNLLEKQEEERRYFAKELHDEIGQGLTLIKIQHQLPEPDQQLISHVLSELIDKVRNLSLNLRPAILDDMGLSAALDWLVGRQRKFSQLEFVINIDNDIPRLSDKIEISVFRIAQETFTNIHKYSHAKHVEFSCHVDNEMLVLKIKDDGIGFDVDAKFNRATQSQSLGLVSIKERAFLIDGQIKMESNPESGTLIELTVPLKKVAGEK